MNPSNELNRYKEIASIFPIGSIFIILCSSAKLYLYYKTFNINIFDFIELNEFFILFIDDILYYGMIFSFALMIDFIQSRVSKDSLLSKKAEKPINQENNSKVLDKTEGYNSNKIESIEEVNEELINSEKKIKELESKINESKESIAKIRNQYSIIARVLYLLIPTILVATVAIAVFYPNNSTKAIIIFILLSVGIGASYILCIIKHIKISSFEYLAVLTVVYSINFGFFDGYEIKENGSTNEISFHYENEILISSDSVNIYLGKTKEFMFMYNLKENIANIYSMEGVNKIEVFPRKK